MSMRNSLAQNQSALLAVAQINSDGTVGAVGGPLAHSADLSSVKNSTGNYTVTLNPFKGPRGVAFAKVNLFNNAGQGYADSTTYTDDSLAVVVLTFAVDGTT